ncbi:MAG: hypothetical protein JSS81_30435 [Acidobacteria bacterium]|nr:hypothetical protein [Acidobacteriota bacterium]
MKKILLVTGMAILLAACGGGNPGGGNTGGGNSAASNSGSAPANPAKPAGGAIEVKIKDKTYKLEPKAQWLFSEDWTVNMPDGKAVPTAMRYLVAANYELETTYGRSNTMKKIEAADGVRIMVAIEDKADVKKDAPPTAGDYGPKTEEFQKLNNIQIFTKESGMTPAANITGSNSDNKGGVKITAVDGDTVTGEFDFSSTDYAIKGPFTAKIWKEAKK